MVNSGFQFTSAPFVRLILALCLGVCLEKSGLHLPTLFFIVLLFIAVVTLLILKNIAFLLQPIWAIILFLAILFIGFARTQEKEILFPTLNNQRYFVVLDTYPIEKAKTYQVVCQMINSDLKILTYVPKSPAVKRA